MVIRYVLSRGFMLKKSEIIFQMLQGFSPKISFTVHVTKGIYNSTHQSTNSFALEIAYFNHIQADRFRSLLNIFYPQKHVTLLIHI